MHKTKFFFMVGIILMLGGWGQEMVGYEKISKTWPKKYNVETWKVTSFYGGDGVIINDTVAYWLQGDTIYACNGAAMALSPGLPQSPPSVSMSTIEQVINGNILPMPRHFSWPYKNFIAAMLEDLAPFGFKKSIWSQYEIPGVEFHVEETGGRLTKAGMSYRADKDTTEASAKTMIAMMHRLAPNLTDKEIKQTLKGLIIDSASNLGEPIPTVQDGVTFCVTSTEIKGKRYTELTATP